MIGVTIIPRGNEKAWTHDMERQRLAVKDWIRHGANFDGLIDFDALMQGPLNFTNNSVTLPPQWSCSDNDGVHPNSAGYAAMGSFIDLSLFFAHAGSR
jgi:lysophospholipase L1-like esterase